MSEEITIPESIEEMQESLKRLRNIASLLTQDNVRLRVDINRVTRENLELINTLRKLKVTAAAGIEASILILTQITDSKTAHWQKKENIRLTIGVLSTLQTQILKPISSYDDDL